MSGHSKWSTIKHQKAANDQKRGQLFTKLAKAITIAAKEGGGDLETNFKLRLTMDRARQANMPKSNIERAIDKGAGQGGDDGLFEVVYEGFGPGQTAVIVEAVTDNKNRTSAEIKKMFDKMGGKFGQSGSVAFQFDRKGQILVEVKGDEEEQTLKLIDFGAEEVEKAGEFFEVLVQPDRLFELSKKITKEGFVVKQAELVYVAKNMLELKDEEKSRALKFLEALDDLDDVQNVFTNADL